jgi:hypothetical protein
VRDVLRRDANSRVTDFSDGDAILGEKAKVNATSGRSVFYGVIEKDEKEALKRRGVPANPESSGLDPLFRF